MATFVIEIQSSAGQVDLVENVVSFVGKDHSGHFGILANAEKRMSVLSFGLAKYRCQKEEAMEPWQYLALPGGVICFQDNRLTIATRKFVRGSHLMMVREALEKEIKEAELLTQETRRSLHRLDEEILSRLSRLNWRGEI